MKRFWAFIAACLFLLLTACGGSGTPLSTPTSTPRACQRKPRRLAELHFTLAERYFKARSIAIVTDQRIGNVQRRVAALLLSYSTPEAGGRKALVIRQLPTQHELAAMANTSRESVSRVLRSLMEQGLIVREGRALVIPDPSAMDRLIQTPELAATQ